MSFNKRYLQIMADASCFKSELCLRILELPTNHIKSNCFTVKSSELGEHTILSAKYYNYHAQYKEISERISRVSVERIEASINSILKEHQYHPIVLKNVKTLWEEIQ